MVSSLDSGYGIWLVNTVAHSIGITASHARLDAPEMMMICADLAAAREQAGEQMQTSRQHEKPGCSKLQDQEQRIDTSSQACCFVERSVLGVQGIAVLPWAPSKTQMCR